MPPLAIIPIEGIGEIRPATRSLPAVADRGRRAGHAADLDGDCLVVTQKIVSKAEGRLVPLDHDDRAARDAIIAGESVRILRRRGDLVISETRHGFVCANAGVDLSNVDDGVAALLPVDGDRSAHRIRNAIRATAGVDGRGRRLRHVRAGLAPRAHRRRDRGRRHRRGRRPRGDNDDRGQELQVTEVAIADEIAGAAELVDGQGRRASRSRSCAGSTRRGSAPARSRDLVRPAADDLFR